MTWLIIIHTTSLITSIKSRKTIYKTQLAFEAHRNRVSKLIQRKFHAFLMGKYRKIPIFKEIFISYMTMSTSASLLELKTKKKSMAILGKFMLFIKGELNFIIYMQRFGTKICKIQKIFKEKIRRNQEKLKNLKDLWDKIVIKMIKDEINLEANEKKKKKKKKTNIISTRKMDKIKMISIDIKEKTLMKYFTKQLTLYKQKIRDFSTLCHSLSKEQKIVSTFLKQTAYNRRNSLFNKNVTTEENIKEESLDCEKMNGRYVELRNLKKPNFEYMPNDQIMETMIEEVLEQL